MRNRDLVNAVWDLHRANHSQRPIEAETDVNQFIANLFCPGPNFHFIFDFADRTISGVSTGVEAVLGIDAAVLTTQYMITALLHPADMEHIGKCEDLISEHSLQKIPSEKITSYKYAYYFRLKHDQGHYLPILHQAMPLSTDQFGRLSKVLVVETDISFWEGPLNRHLSIIGLNGEPSTIGIQVDGSLDEQFAAQEQAFTVRELEIIRLFADGYTAKKIADLLHLSVGTVRTHRQNVLSKSKCRNMTALVAYCIRRGLV